MCSGLCQTGPKTSQKSTPGFLAISSPTGADDLGDLDGSQVLFPRLALDSPVPVTPHKSQQQKDPLNGGTWTAICSFERLDTKNEDMKKNSCSSWHEAGSLPQASHTWLSFTMRSILNASACTVQFDILLKKTPIRPVSEHSENPKVGEERGHAGTQFQKQISLSPSRIQDYTPRKHLSCIPG